jgi:predicted molibdopterin-dependent oxidoreductase YjgC
MRSAALKPSVRLGILRDHKEIGSMPRKQNAAGSYPRLTEPLVRERGRLRAATWDEALDVAADGFRRNMDARGPNSLGIFSCSKATNEVNYLAGKLARVAFGNNNIDSCNRT